MCANPTMVHSTTYHEVFSNANRGTVRDRSDMGRGPTCWGAYYGNTTIIHGLTFPTTRCLREVTDNRSSTTCDSHVRVLMHLFLTYPGSYVQEGEPILPGERPCDRFSYEVYEYEVRRLERCTATAGIHACKVLEVGGGHVARCSKLGVTTSQGARSQGWSRRIRLRTQRTEDLDLDINFDD